MSQTVTLRLPDGVANWLKATARRAGRSVNDIGASLFEEARRVSEFGDIEFRSFSGKRHACLKGHLQVWQIIWVARQYRLDAEETARYFGWPTWKSTAALKYYAAYQGEIDPVIAENDAIGYDELKVLLPQMTLIEVTISDDAGDSGDEGTRNSF